jgi:endothelin-converting enzyme/putative endopeptidase
MSWTHSHTHARIAAILALATGGACETYHPLPNQPGVEDVAIDWTASPCDDFYQFACGNWAYWHPIAADGAISSRVLSVQADQTRALTTIVYDDAFQGPPHPDDDYATQIGDFYQSCYYEPASSFAPPSDLLEQLTNVGGLRSLPDLAALLAGLHRDGVAAGFGIGFDPDPGQPARQIVHLFDGGIGMDPAYYQDPALASTLTAYRAHIDALVRAFASAFGVAPALDGNAVLRIETGLAAASLSDTQARDPNATYHLTTFDALQALTPHFDWSSYFASASALGSSPADVNVVNPAFLTELEQELQSAPIADLRAYLTWRVLEAAAPTFGGAIADAEFEFHDHQFLGRAAPLPAYWRCFLATRSRLGFAVSRPFVAERFSAASRDAATRLIESIRGAMAATLASRDWLDDTTRAAAADKLAAVLPKVGYPDVWPSLSGFDTDPVDYFANRTNLSRFDWQRAVNSLASPADRGIWLMPPWITNAYYSPERNDIVFPAGILQPPFFDENRPAAANYGAIGSIMGHELTHGFDDQGRKYDGTGALVDWWTPAVADEFSRRTACLVQQYGAFEPLPGSHIDGALTLGENLADVGGLKLAYAAFHAPDGGASAGAPGFFTPDQQFFIAFAQDWCENERPTYEGSLLLTDPHSPPRYRVNGSVANVPEFAAAFRCGAGAALASADRCDVW